MKYTVKSNIEFGKTTWSIGYVLSAKDIEALGDAGLAQLVRARVLDVAKVLPIDNLDKSTEPAPAPKRGKK